MESYRGSSALCLAPNPCIPLVHACLEMSGKREGFRVKRESLGSISLCNTIAHKIDTHYIQF